MAKVTIKQLEEKLKVKQQEIEKLSRENLQLSHRSETQDSQIAQCLKAIDTAEASSNYYRAQLTDAHILIGRITHQASAKLPLVQLSEQFPTSNQLNQRNTLNPRGYKEYAQNGSNEHKCISRC